MKSDWRLRVVKKSLSEKVDLKGKMKWAFWLSGERVVLTKGTASIKLGQVEGCGSGGVDWGSQWDRAPWGIQRNGGSKVRGKAWDLGMVLKMGVWWNGVGSWSHSWLPAMEGRQPGNDRGPEVGVRQGWGWGQQGAAVLQGECESLSKDDRVMQRGRSTGTEGRALSWEGWSGK